MKKSAMIRIVVYSLLILLLVGILAAGMAFHRNFGWNGVGRILSEEMDLDVVDGDEEYLDEEDLEKFTASQDQKISLEAGQIHEILVEWVAGEVRILPGDTGAIEIQETESKKPLVYSVKNGKLKIQFCEEILGMKFGTGLRMPSKDLTITVPADWAGEELEIHSVSADVEIRELSLEELEFQGVSGRCDLQDCMIGELSLETVSGRVSMSGQVRELECESVSADCELVLTNVPREISMEGVSGSLDLTLPADAGSTVKMNGLAKDLDTDFAVTAKDGRFAAGDGSCKIEIDGISGKVRIRQAK